MLKESFTKLKAGKYESVNASASLKSSSAYLTRAPSHNRLVFEKNPESDREPAQRKARGAHSFERVSVTQVEAGPQDGTLLVTWQPVALSGSAVTGYAVYADGKKVTDVDSPTGDHALVDIHKLMGLNPRQITVRTKSRESQSGDSCATAIPCNVLRGQF